MKRVVVVLAMLGLLIGCRGGAAFVQGLNQGLRGNYYQQQQQQQRWNQERAYRERADFHRMQEQMRWDNPHMR